MNKKSMMRGIERKVRLSVLSLFSLHKMQKDKFDVMIINRMVGIISISQCFERLDVQLNLNYFQVNVVNFAVIDNLIKYRNEGMLLSKVK